jgi:hypothetical protein
VTVQVIGTLVNLQTRSSCPTYAGVSARAGLSGAGLVLGLAGIAIIAGVLLALWRRLALQPRSLETRRDDLACSASCCCPRRLPGRGPAAGGAAPAWANWPVGLALAAHLRGLGLTGLPPRRCAWAWWFHVAAAVLFVAAIPFSKLRHLVAIR